MNENNQWKKKKEIFHLPSLNFSSNKFRRLLVRVLVISIECTIIILSLCVKTYTNEKRLSPNIPDVNAWIWSKKFIFPIESLPPPQPVFDDNGGRKRVIFKWRSMINVSPSTEEIVTNWL